MWRTRREGGVVSHSAWVPGGGVNFVQSAHGATRPYRFQALLLVRPLRPEAASRHSMYTPMLASETTSESAPTAIVRRVGRPALNKSQMAITATIGIAAVRSQIGR